jgi:hypothetical protein
LTIRDLLYLRLLKDFFFLLVFGSLGVSICYAKCLDQYFERSLWFSGVACAWMVLHLSYRGYTGEPKSPWEFWSYVNGIQLFFLIVAYACPETTFLRAVWPEHTLGPPWQDRLLGLFLVYFGLLGYDVYRQLRVLGENR